MKRLTLIAERIKLTRYGCILEENIMNRTLKVASAVLLLMLGTVTALAEPGRNWRDERAGQREEQYRQRLSRPGREQSGQRGTAPEAVPEAPKRKAMSPEERRALRRQIHEAGRDIYNSPNR